MNKKNIKKILPIWFIKAIRNIMYRPVINYFKTYFKRNVLISYVVYPFRRGISFSHTNSIEALIIAEVFKEMGFNVDIFNYSYEKKINFEKYDLIFGFGEPLCNSFYNRNRKIITIYYGTGMHVEHQNFYTLKRVKDVYLKKEVWMPESGRIVEKTWSIQTTLVDAMILLGNKVVEKTYRKYYDGPVYLLKPSCFEVIPYNECLDLIKYKNWVEAKRHFLWFGSTGLIHKGLDLLLDFFEKRKDLNLHICGPIDNEINFKKVYYDKLYNCQNIHTYGFIDIRSDLFKNLMKKCGFIIFPSCSEGGSPSVLNCMANGLIPIVTEYTTIDIEDFGIYISGFTEKDISLSVECAISLSENNLIERALKTFEYTRQNHNINLFKSNFMNILKNILK